MKRNWWKWLVGTLAVILVLVLLSPLWIGPVVRTAAHTAVPMYTKTPFNLGHFALNGYTGHLELGDMQLENPEGCDQRLALTLGKLSVDFDPASLVSDVVVLENVEVQDLFVCYVFDRNGRSNIDTIMKNVSGEPTEAVPAASDGRQVKSASASPAPAKAASKAKDETPVAEAGPRKKIIIDRVRISGVLVQVGKLTVPIPSITLTGIGRRTNGVLPEDAWKEIAAKFTQSMGALGAGLLNFGMSAKDKGAELTELGKTHIDKAAKAVKDLKLGDSVNEGADKAVKALKGLFQ